MVEHGPSNIGNFMEQRFTKFLAAGMNLAKADSFREYEITVLTILSLQLLQKLTKALFVNIFHGEVFGSLQSESEKRFIFIAQEFSHL